MGENMKETLRKLLDAGQFNQPTFCLENTWKAQCINMLGMQFREQAMNTTKSILSSLRQREIFLFIC